MAAEQTECGSIERAWNAWMKFWFTPADPTPLCLMRIAAGILTLYVHIAYSFDLVAFYGPDAWISREEANLARHTMPYMKTQLDWDPVGQDGIQMPADPRQREVLKSFVLQVLKQPDYERTRNFLQSITYAGEERNEVLRYLRTFPKDPTERTALLKPYLEDKLSPDEKEQLPKYFQRQVTAEARLHFTTELARFHDMLPQSDGDRSIMLNLLLDSTPEDWEALQRFLAKMARLSPEDRAAELDYQALWGVASEHAHAKGMAVYSPWFHVTDVQLLWRLHILHIFVILLFTLGMYTRVTSVMTWLVGLSYINRAQPYLFGQDTMMNVCLLFLMFSPCNAKWSLDRYMARKRAEARGLKLPPPAPSVSAGFALRLFQVQYCLMYFSAGLSKLKGSSWWNGTALFGCLANAEFAPMHVEIYRSFLNWLCRHRIIWEFFMSGSAIFTLVTEIPFPYAVWTPARYVMVAMAILLHTGIAILMGLTVFSLFMFTLVLCWMPPDAINWMFEGRPETA